MVAPRARVSSRLRGRPASRPPWERLAANSLRLRGCLILALPAVSPVPIAQGVALIRAVIALSRLTHVAAITGGCRGGLGGRNEGGQSQRGDEQLHGWFHPVTDHRPSVRATAHGPIGRRLRREHLTGGAAVL